MKTEKEITQEEVDKISADIHLYYNLVQKAKRKGVKAK
jgi:hypothetical protein